MLADAAAVDSPGWGARRLLGRRGVRVAVGLLWLLDAGLQAEPGHFAATYPLGQLAQSVMGDPQWVNHSIYAGIDPFVAHWALWNLAATVLQAAIGICLVTDRQVRPAIIASLTWGVVIWWLGEGFGTLPSGFALMAGGAPGAALLYPVLGLLAWPRHDRPDVARRKWSASWVVLWVGSDTGNLKPNQTKTITAPTKAGTYPFFCLIHNYMTGTLTVS